MKYSLIYLILEIYNIGDMQMNYYDPLREYEKQVEIWEDMTERGIEDMDEYYNAIQEEKEDAQRSTFEKG